jgi:KaiC/GvpD/RAD55 family RecA-like ATPase
MVKKELLQRSPVRAFEKAIDGGLSSGEIGLICSPPGMGKTSVLVQIALDKLLQDKKIIHISFTQHADYILSWYEDIFDEFIRKKNVENERELQAELVRNRILLNFNQEGVNSDVIRKSLKAMIVDGGYKADAIIVDGFDFSISKRERIATLKEFARDLGLCVWYSCSVLNDYNKNRLPNVIQSFEDCVDVVMVLEPKSSHVGLYVAKNRDKFVNSTELLRLDTKTLLLLEESSARG